MLLQTEHHIAKLQWPEQMEATAYHHEAAGAVTCCRSLAACAGTCRAGACEAAVTAELFRGLAAVSPHSTEIYCYKLSSSALSACTGIAQQLS